MLYHRCYTNIQLNNLFINILSKVQCVAMIIYLFEGAAVIKTKQYLCFHSAAYLKPNFYIGIVNKTKCISIKKPSACGKEI